MQAHKCTMGSGPFWFMSRLALVLPRHHQIAFSDLFPFLRCKLMYSVPKRRMVYLCKERKTTLIVGLTAVDGQKDVEKERGWQTESLFLLQIIEEGISFHQASCWSFPQEGVYVCQTSHLGCPLRGCTVVLVLRPLQMQDHCVQNIRFNQETDNIYNILITTTYPTIHSTNVSKADCTLMLSFALVSMKRNPCSSGIGM